jgi:hypothetical protein
MGTGNFSSDANASGGNAGSGLSGRGLSGRGLPGSICRKPAGAAIESAVRSGGGGGGDFVPFTLGVGLTTGVAVLLLEGPLLPFTLGLGLELAALPFAFAFAASEFHRSLFANSRGFALALAFAFAFAFAFAAGFVLKLVTLGDGEIAPGTRSSAITTSSIPLGARTFFSSESF